MLSQRLANIIFAIVLLIASAYFAWVAEGFKAAGLLASSGLPSKFFPQLTLAAIAVCAVLVVIFYIRNRDADKDTVFGRGSDARRGLLMLVVAVLSYMIWRSFGFIPMAVLLGPASLVAMGVWNVWIYATVWVLTGFAYVVFTQALGVQLV